MKCVICHRKIDPSRERYEEVGPIEFAHVECREKVDRETVNDVVKQTKTAV